MIERLILVFTYLIISIHNILPLKFNLNFTVTISAADKVLIEESGPKKITPPPPPPSFSSLETIPITFLSLEGLSDK